MTATSFPSPARTRPATGQISVARLWRLRDHLPQAREELIRRHLPLARGLAARYRNPNEPLEDIVQVASIGLVKAVDRFDSDRGTSFSSFAAPTILGEIRRHFRDTAWSVHVPRGAQELAQRIQKAAAEMAERSGRSPRVPELAERLGLSIEDVLEGLEAGQAHFASSLDAPAGSTVPTLDPEEPSLLERTGAGDAGYSLVETSISLTEGIKALPDAERTAIVLRLGHDLTQSEIAVRMDCSQMQVSRLLRRAADLLRRQIRA